MKKLHKSIKYIYQNACWVSVHLVIPISPTTTKIAKRLRCLVATQSCLLSVLIQALQGVHVDVCKHDQVRRTRVVVCCCCCLVWVGGKDFLFFFSFSFIYSAHYGHFPVNTIFCHFLSIFHSSIFLLLICISPIGDSLCRKVNWMRRLLRGERTRFLWCSFSELLSNIG